MFCCCLCRETPFYCSAQGTTLSTWSGEQRRNDRDKYHLPGLVDRSFIDGDLLSFEDLAVINAPAKNSMYTQGQKDQPSGLLEAARSPESAAAGRASRLPPTGVCSPKN